MSILVYSQPRCAFVRVRKTGSTSIIQGLLGGREAAVRLPPGELPEDFDERFSFGFVRHPLDRAMSALAMFSDYPTETEEEEDMRPLAQPPRTPPPPPPTEP